MVVMLSVAVLPTELMGSQSFQLWTSSSAISSDCIRLQVPLEKGTF